MGGESNNEKADAIPKIVDEIIDQLMLDGHFKKRPNQVIVNKYIPGQGTYFHP
jgi:hypothetical protein